jgi:hypothetical protein
MRLSTFSALRRDLEQEVQCKDAVEVQISTVLTPSWRTGLAGYYRCVTWVSNIRDLQCELLDATKHCQLQSGMLYACLVSSYEEPSDNRNHFILYLSSAWLVWLSPQPWCLNGTTGPQYQSCRSMKVSISLILQSKLERRCGHRGH